MILIVGGAFQGKKKFAETLTGLTEEAFAVGRTCAFADVFEKQAVCAFHILVRRLMEAGEDPFQFAERLEKQQPQMVIVSSEIGYGVVPMEAADRLYRETVGRVCTRIAASADAVYRVVCGVGMRIK